MTREELRAIEGLTDAQIDTIIALHGRDATASNQQITDLRAQLTTAQQGLAAFEGVDVNQLNGEIQRLNNQLAVQAAEFQFNSLLRAAARTADALSEDDVISLLPNRGTLQQSQNQAADIQTAMEAFKTSKPYMFQTPAAPADPDGNEPPSPPTLPIIVPKPRVPAGNDPKLPDFIDMSGMQRMELRAKNPTLFNLLLKELNAQRR